MHVNHTLLNTGGALVLADKGICLIDEFDKAPTEVVVVLKALLEDGEILLADGRRFVRSNSKMLGTGDNIKPIADGFKVIACYEHLFILDSVFGTLGISSTNDH